MGQQPGADRCPLGLYSLARETDSSNPQQPRAFRFCVCLFLFVKVFVKFITKCDFYKRRSIYIYTNTKHTNKKSLSGHIL